MKLLIKMPCGSNISCLECINYIMVTRECTYIDIMSEKEKTKFDNKLKKHYNMKKNILTEQANHSLIDCLRELKFGRPVDAQNQLDEFIAVCSESMRTDAANPDDTAIDIWGSVKTLPEEEVFKMALAGVLNEHALDVYMNVPDYILAEYLNGCLNELGRFKAILKHHDK